MTDEELEQLSDLLERNLPSEPYNPRVYPSNFHTEMDATMEPQYGMTLLDFFAEGAMKEIMKTQYDYSGWEPGKIAEDAYIMAEAMLKERQKHI